MMKEHRFLCKGFIMNIHCVHSPGTPASSTTKTGRHDIAEILLKVALNTKKSNHYPSLHIIDIR